MEENKNFEINKLAIRITTEFDRSIKDPICGSGVLYITSSPEYDYVFTALHCLLGKRTQVNGENIYEQSLTAIKHIILENNQAYDNPSLLQRSSINEIEQNVLIISKHDFAVIKVGKDFAKSIGNVPQIAIHTKSRKEGKFKISGYTEKKTTDLLPLNPSFNHADPFGVFTATSSGLSGEASIELLEGYSGSGVFLESKPILVGIVTKVRDENIFANNLYIRDLSYINIQELLRSRDLEEVVLIDNAHKVIYNDSTNELTFTSAFEINGVGLNIWKAIENTRNDIKDDWFQDPLRFYDILKPDYICDILKDNIVKNQKYKPGSAKQYFIPKEGFTTRNAIQTSLVDRIVLQASVDFIAEELEKILHNHVYSYRYNFTETRNEYFFIHHVEQWKKLLYKIKEQVCSGNKILVVVDISNYFDNIPISKLTILLGNWVKNASPEEREKLSAAVQLIDDILKSWKAKDSVQSGIPQNRDASSFLANIYLAEVDLELIQKGYSYYRYMDDIRFVCDDHFGAQKAIMDLTELLAGLGLNINASKTHIIEYRSDPLLDEKFKKYFPEDVKMLEQIDNLIATKRTREIQMAVTITMSYFDQVLKDEEKNKALNFRHFSFCISRLQLFAQVSSLRELIDFEKIVKILVPRFKTHPWLTDVYSKFLMSINSTYFTTELIDEIGYLLLEKNKNVYSWQAFHLWKLLAFHKIKRTNLLERAGIVVFDEHSNSRTAEIAAATLYISATGYNEYGARLLRYFNSNQFSDDLLKRCFVIALRKVNSNELDFRDDKELQRMHKELATNEEFPQYVSPLPPLKLSKILRNLPDKIST